MSHLSTTAIGGDSSRRGSIMALAAILALAAVISLAGAGPVTAGQAVSNAPADVGTSGSSQLAVMVVGAGVIGVLLFGVRLLTSRRARRQ